MQVTADERLEEIERRMRKQQLVFWSTFITLLVILVCGLTTTVQSATPKEVRAKRFVLVGENDSVVGEFGIAPEDGSVRLFVRKGAGAWIGVRADGTPALALLRSSGLPRLQIDGGEQASGLSIFGEKEMVSLRSDPRDSSALKLLDSRGQVRVLLGADADDPSSEILLVDSHGRKRAATFVDQTGNVGMGLWDDKGGRIWAPEPVE